MKSRRLTQLAFSLGRLFGQNMASVRLIAFKIAAAISLEPFTGAAVAFHFWHLFSPIVIIKYVPEIKTRQGKMQGPAELVVSTGYLYECPFPGHPAVLIKTAKTIFSFSGP